jgi:hypothetical protein
MRFNQRDRLRGNLHSDMHDAHSMKSSVGVGYLEAGLSNGNGTNSRT